MTTPSPASCDEKTALVLRYQQAVREYSDAVQELSQKLGKSSKSEYEAIYRIAEAARARSITARDALEKHTKEHGC